MDNISCKTLLFMQIISHAFQVNLYSHLHSLTISQVIFMFFNLSHNILCPAAELCPFGCVKSDSSNGNSVEICVTLIVIIHISEKNEWKTAFSHDTESSSNITFELSHSLQRTVDVVESSEQ